MTVIKLLLVLPSLGLAVFIAAPALGPVSCLAASETNHPKRTSSQEVKPEPTEQFFTNAAVPHLKIEITGTDLTNLRDKNREYVRATVREGAKEEKVYTDVGIHLKGAAGSFRGLDDKPALTLNFDKFKEHQKFHGLDKIHLNNSVQDPSYMTEHLCGTLFREADVPASRVSFARVWLNGRDLGFYVLKEGFDKQFLRLYYRNPNGNLYDGGFLREITEPLDRISGHETNGYAALKAAAAAATEPDPNKRLQRLDQVLDLERFISFIAVEIMTWHWDGYALKRNNYRVYHDPEADKIVFFPHGMDQMFWEANGPLFPNMEGLVARKVLETTEGHRRYRARMSELLTNVFKIEVLTNRINELQARIRPELMAINPEVARNHDGAVDHLRAEVIGRCDGLQRLLSIPEPQPLKFDNSGFASLSAWRTLDPLGSALLDRVGVAGSKRTLHIRAGPSGKCTASWRSRVLLVPGRYRCEGLVRTAGVVALEEPTAAVQKGKGAGIRVHGSLQPRSNEASGDTDWQKVEYDFAVDPSGGATEVVCELRAAKGEAWFDLDSLRLVRKDR